MVCTRENNFYIGVANLLNISVISMYVSVEKLKVMRA